MINYFNFKEFDKNNMLLTNDFGDYIFLSKNDFRSFLSNSVPVDSELYNNLVTKQFILSNDEQKIIDSTQSDYRLSKSYLLSSTSLHIFVVSNECNMRCIYCQARNDNTHKKGIMSKEVAKKAVDIALQTPEKVLNFEFQGGEPLTNFDIIKYIVDYAEKNKDHHVINYSLVSNITLMADEILNFCIDNRINISTSLDGSKQVHDFNRCFLNGAGTFDDVLSNIKHIKKNNLRIGAIQTTTKVSLNHPKEIIDQYLESGFDNIFIRPLTPLGTAKDNWGEIGYTAQEFLEYYKKSIEYIIELNLKGYKFKEGHAQLFLQKIMRKSPSNYMELRSPCGAGVGQVAYYHNGDVFTCDEGRMLSEMGDDAFKIGNVFDSNYSDIISCETCKAVCSSSVLESLPGCCDCVYQPYCGVCPVINYAQEKNIFRRDINNYRCDVYKGMLDIIFGILLNGKEEEKQVLKEW